MPGTSQSSRDASVSKTKTSCPFGADVIPAEGQHSDFDFKGIQHMFV